MTSEGGNDEQGSESFGKKAHGSIISFGRNDRIATLNWMVHGEWVSPPRT